MTSLSKEEYLKRYLSPQETGEKVKKKKKSKKQAQIKKVQGLKIVDDDASWNTFAPNPDEYDEVNDKLLTTDELPQIENIDVRTEEEKKLDEYRKSKMWRTFDSTNSNTNTDKVSNIRHDSDSDMSPPRNQKLAKRKARHDSDSDMSPPRNHKSAKRKARHDSDSDMSPPRNKKSAKRKARHDSDSDMSPPRSKKLAKRKARYDSDSDLDMPRAHAASQTRKHRHDSDSDLDNLPREHEKALANSDSDIEVPRTAFRKPRHNSDSDIEVPRTAFRKSRHNSDSDIDVPRAKTSKKVKRRRHDSDSDLEVKRNSTSSKQPTQKVNMQSGSRGGLTSVDLLRLEMQKLEKKESAIKKMAEEYKNSETVYRERGSGKKRDVAKEKKQSEEENQRKKLKEEQYNKWGKGLKQAEMRAEAIADTLHESNKSLTRYNDDEDLETMRKAAIRKGDPMAEYIARKKRKEKGIVEERPKYKGPAPAPNRFNIMPGYRWDGVDRSNGFEKRYYQSLSDKQAHKDEYYKWSVGDM